MAQIDCDDCNKWCLRMEDNKTAVCLCTNFGRCFVGTVATISVAFHVAIPIINIVTICWYAESFDSVVCFYLATVGLECLFQLAAAIPTWSIMLLYHSPVFNVCRYVVPYFYPSIFVLTVINCTLSMVKSNAGYKMNSLLFVMGRILVTLATMVFYNMAGEEKIKQQNEQQRLERMKTNPPPPTVYYLSFPPRDPVRYHVQPRREEEEKVYVEINAQD